MAIKIHSIANRIKYRQTITPSNPQQYDTWYNMAGKYFIYDGGWVEVFVQDSITGGPGSNYGYFIGIGGTAIVDRIMFPFDSGAPTQVGSNDATITSFTTCNSSQRAYLMGGNQTNPVNYIRNFEFPYDSGNYASCGTLNYSAYTPSGFNCSTYGFCAGGINPGAGNAASNLNRITFPMDSGIADQYGSIGREITYASGANSSQHGYIYGGSDDSNYLNTVYRAIFPMDSGNMTYVGSLAVLSYYNSSLNSGDAGYTLAGITSGGGWISIIQKLSFPFDSGTSEVVGSLTKSVLVGGTCNSTQHGYYGGGYDISSTIDRIEFPFDSGISSVVGNCSGSGGGNGIDGVDFVTQFV